MLDKINEAIINNIYKNLYYIFFIAGNVVIVGQIIILIFQSHYIYKKIKLLKRLIFKLFFEEKVFFFY